MHTDQINDSSTSKHSSWNVVNQIIKDKSLNVLQTENDIEIRKFLKNLHQKSFSDIIHKDHHMKIYLF